MMQKSLRNCNYTVKKSITKSWRMKMLQTF